MRIVSLLASATEIVCALSAGDLLVGRSHECDHPAWVRQLPRCSEPTFDITMSSGDIDAEVRRRLRAGEPLYRIDHDLIRELRPDLILTQAHCEVCAVTPADLQREGAGELAARQLSLSASTVSEVFEGIHQVASALGRQVEGEALIQQQQDRLQRVRERTRHCTPKTVVMLEWTDPLFAMGNWGPELVACAHGELLLGHHGEYSTAIRADLLREADPEHLIIAPCGFDLQRSLNERSTLERLPWWSELRAVRSGNVAFADGNLFFNRSGTSLSQTAEIIAEILHGISFGDASAPHWVRLQPASGAPAAPAFASRA